MYKLWADKFYQIYKYKNKKFIIVESFSKITSNWIITKDTN